MARAPKQVEPTSLSATRTPALLLAPLALAPVTAPAQSRLDWEAHAVVANVYHWRGIRRADGFVLQPDAWLRLRRGRATFSAGAWANVELGTHRDSSLSDLRPGHWGPSEADLWLQAATRLGGIDGAAGAILYHWIGEQRRHGTEEVYARLRLPAVYAAPALSAWVDLNRVRGSYWEATAAVPLFANPLPAPRMAVHRMAAPQPDAFARVVHRFATAGKLDAAKSMLNWDAQTHMPLLIHPNPLNRDRYVVLNSGPTHREAHDHTNSLQNPKLPDWAIVDLTTPPSAEAPGRVADADFFDEQWRVKRRE